MGSRQAAAYEGSMPNLTSVPIPDPDLVACAIFRQGSHKRDLTDDYARLCRALV